ncbi:hypothetical protein H4R35_006183, partial [Dimargaris xerosporica]
ILPRPNHRHPQQSALRYHQGPASPCTRSGFISRPSWKWPSTIPPWQRSWNAPPTFCRPCGASRSCSSSATSCAWTCSCIRVPS